MTPSGISWQEWLLSAAVAGVVYLISSGAYHARIKRGLGLSGPIAFCSGVAGAVCSVMGIIRFIGSV